MDLIKSDLISFQQIELIDELVDKFNCFWKRYLGDPSMFLLNITKPYFYMQHQPLWKLIEKYYILFLHRLI